MNRLRIRLATLLVLLLSLTMVLPADAASRKVRRRAPARTYSRRAARPAVIREPFAAALVVDADNGRVLFQKDPDELRVPASLTKMMTALLTMEALERGLVKLSDTVTVPAEVRSTGGTRVRLKAGERLPLLEALKAMMISSANDAALTVACHVAGSQQRFISLMNLRARELGMTRTHYASVHGLECSSGPFSVTSARDQALLARTLLHYPLALALSSTEWDTIRTRQVIHTTNRLLGRCPGVDGLKTGYTAKAGFCLVSTANREGLRLVSVVLGATSNRRRFSESQTLLDQAYSRYQRVPVIRKGQDLGKACMVEGGSPPQVRLVAGEDVSVLLPARDSREITLRVNAPVSLEPPVVEGKPLGLLQVLVGDSLAAEVPAVAGRSARRSGLLNRLGWPAFD